MTVFANAVLGPDGRPLDQIRLTGVSATGHHGVFEHERVDGQEFRADVVLHLDTRPAAVGDDLAATVSYADVAQDVHDVLAGSPADLIETVAERVASAVLARPGVVAVDVRLHKPQAPIAVPFDDVEVAIRRDHVKAPVVEALPPGDAADMPAAVEAAPEPETPPVPSAGLVPSAPEPGGASTQAAAAADPFAAHPIDRLEADPPDAVEAILAIGANLGDAQATLRAAVTDLDRLPGIQVMEVSPLARTTAVGGPDEQPDYLNAVLVVRTTLAARSLLRATQAVENAHGRVREERWGPRTLDIDIVRYGTVVADAEDLTIPHPRAHERAFVLVPWAEVQPDAVLPGLGGGPVRQLADTAPDRAGIRWLALDWLQEPAEATGAHPVAHSEPVERVAQPAHSAFPAADPGPATSGAAPRDADAYLADDGSAAPDLFRPAESQPFAMPPAQPLAEHGPAQPFAEHAPGQPAMPPTALASAQPFVPPAPAQPPVSYAAPAHAQPVPPYAVAEPVPPHPAAPPVPPHAGAQPAEPVAAPFHRPQAGVVQHIHAPVPSPSNLWPSGMAPAAPPAGDATTPPPVPAPPSTAPASHAPQAPQTPQVPEAEQTSVDQERWIPLHPDGGR